MAAALSAIHQAHGPTGRLVFTWTTDALGDATTGALAVALYGHVEKIVAVTNAAGNTADLTLVGDDGADLLGGLGANITGGSVVNHDPIYLGAAGHYIAAHTLSLNFTVDDGEDTKTGTAYVYYTGRVIDQR